MLELRGAEVDCDSRQHGCPQSHSPVRPISVPLVLPLKSHPHPQAPGSPCLPLHCWVHTSKTAFRITSHALPSSPDRYRFISG